MGVWYVWSLFSASLSRSVRSCAPLITTVINELETSSKHKHSFAFGCGCVVPSLTLPQRPWRKSITRVWEVWHNRETGSFQRLRFWGPRPGLLHSVISGRRNRSREWPATTHGGWSGRCEGERLRSSVWTTKCNGSVLAGLWCMVVLRKMKKRSLISV